MPTNLTPGKPLDLLSDPLLGGGLTPLGQSTGGAFGQPSGLSPVGTVPSAPAKKIRNKSWDAPLFLLGGGGLILLIIAASFLYVILARGAAATMFELAREYASQRRQFGRTIGSFQAVRHLLADQYVQLESAWSSVLYAAASLDEREPDAARTVSIAKAYAARATQSVAHGALQVFGGIAFTAEHPAHRYLRRIVVRGTHFGSARDHERNLGRTLAREVEVLA